jgi:hypothetical protein
MEKSPISKVLCIVALYIKYTRELTSPDFVSGLCWWSPRGWPATNSSLNTRWAGWSQAFAQGMQGMSPAPPGAARRADPRAAGKGEGVGRRRSLCRCMPTCWRGGGSGDSSRGPSRPNASTSRTLSSTSAALCMSLSRPRDALMP